MHTFKWDPEPIELAIESVNKEEMKVTDTSKIFNIPCQTLDDRVHRKYGKEGAGLNTELTSEEEANISYCLYMAKSKQPPSVAHIKTFAWIR